MRPIFGRTGLDQRSGGRGLYVFRHTLASRLLAADCPIKSIADVLGLMVLDHHRVAYRTTMTAPEPI